MRVALTRDLYHRPDCSCDVMRVIGHKADRRDLTKKQLEELDHDPCPDSF